MPHADFKLIPGVNTNRTPALNQACVSLCNLIRFMKDDQGNSLIQKLGGWARFYPTSIGSIPRALHAWEDLNNDALLGVGADLGLFEISNGNLKNISPQTLTVNVPVNVSTTSGSPVVTITDTGSAIDNYDAVLIETQITVGGLRLQGLYPTIAASGNTYQIVALDTLGQPLAATSSVSNAGTIPIFTTTTGSYTVNVLLPAHQYSQNQTATFLVPTNVGGITVFGNYNVNAVVDADNFQINVNTIASANDTEPMNAGLARYHYYHGVGPVSAGTGYGIGGYGEGGYGTGTHPITSRISATIGATGNGTTATISFHTNMLLPVGTSVSVSGVTPSGYNGTYAVLGSTAALGNVTAASGTGTTATLTHDAGVTFTVGTAVVVGGLTPSGYNGNHIVTASTSNTVSFASSTTGSLSANGYVEWNTIQILNATTGAQTVAGIITLNQLPGLTASDWSLSNWGELFLSNPVDDAIYYWSPSSGTPVATVIAQAPPVNDGIFVAMPQRQIVAWGSTFTGIKDPLLLRWCDVSDFSVWIGQVTNQAGSYRIPEGSKIVGAIQGPQQGLIWTDVALWSMQYSGQPYIYSFNKIGSGCGLIGRKAAGSLNNVVYWMGLSQFYELGPNGPDPIPCDVWDIVFQQIDKNNYDKIRCCPSSTYGEMRWDFPVAGGNGENSMYVKYTPSMQKWDYGYNSAQNPFVARTAWFNQSVLGAPLGGSANQLIFQHEISPDADGAAMDSWFQSGYSQIASGDWQWFVDQFWPDFKWGVAGGTNNANLIVTFYAVDYAGDTPRTYGPYPFNVATKFLTPRLRGRLFAIKVESNDVGTFYRIGDSRYRYAPDGKF